MGASPPKQVVERKTGTVPDCGRVGAAGDCPEFSADRKVFLSPGYKEKQLRPETEILPRVMVARELVLTE